MNKTTKIGLGLTGIAALASTFLMGKRGSKNRQKLKGWVSKLNSELEGKLKNVSGLNKMKYHQIVDDITDRYQRAKKVGAPELTRLNKELKTGWLAVKKEIVKKKDLASDAKEFASAVEKINKN